MDIKFAVNTRHMGFYGVDGYPELLLNVGCALLVGKVVKNFALSF